MNLIKYIQVNWLPLLFAFIPASIVLGFIDLPKTVYYIMLVLMFGLSLIRIEKFNVSLLLLVLVLFLCCIASIAPPFFKIWERFAFFILILCAVTPLAESIFMNSIRIKILNYMMWFCVFVGSASLICYFLGINFMRNDWFDSSSSVIIHSSGGFGGITAHSMLMGPCASVGLAYILFRLYNYNHNKLQKVVLIILAISCFIVLLLSASRAAFLAMLGGVITILYIKLRGHLIKFLKIIFLFAIGLVVFYPLYSTYSKVMELKQQGNLSNGSTFASREDRWQHRLNEFIDSPIFGLGPSTIDPKYHDEYDPKSGIIEPGSSWLSILSMTGIIGAIAILAILIKTTRRLYRKSFAGDTEAALLLTLLIIFYIHMFAEGYIFAAGNFLCYFFWLIVGVSIVKSER